MFEIWGELLTAASTMVGLEPYLGFTELASDKIRIHVSNHKQPWYVAGLGREI